MKPLPALPKLAVLLAGDFPRLLPLSIGWLAVAVALGVRSYTLVERDA